MTTTIEFALRSIPRTPPVRGERLFGWPAHHAIGSTFAALLLVLLALDAAPSPTLPAALAVGRGTIGAPSFLLQPALLMSRKTLRPGFDSAKSLATHTVLGLGPFLAARGTAPLLAVHP